MEISNVVIVVAASCVLHNLCEMNSEDILSHWVEETTETPDIFPQPDSTDTTQGREDSVSIRDHFANYFASAEGCNIGSV
jgi:hypothetical protein